jgi:hypothetical protein
MLKMVAIVASEIILLQTAGIKTGNIEIKRGGAHIEE